VKFWFLRLRQSRYATALHNVPWPPIIVLTTPVDENLGNERAGLLR